MEEEDKKMYNTTLTIRYDVFERFCPTVVHQSNKSIKGYLEITA